MFWSSPSCPLGSDSVKMCQRWWSSAALWLSHLNSVKKQVVKSNTVFRIHTQTSATVSRTSFFEIKTGDCAPLCCCCKYLSEKVREVEDARNNAHLPYIGWKVDGQLILSLTQPASGSCTIFHLHVFVQDSFLIPLEEFLTSLTPSVVSSFNKHRPQKCQTFSPPSPTSPSRKKHNIPNSGVGCRIGI